jgi:iron complex outermembrane recepter protein
MVKQKQFTPMNCCVTNKFFMFKSLLFAAGMLCSAHSYAQQTITGVLQDAEKRPVPGATVELVTLKKLALSDEKGEFAFSNIPDGSYELVIRHVSFQQTVATVSVPQAAPLIIGLTESTTLTDEVIVYATRANEKTPTTYSDISKEEIRKNNFGQDLPFLLNWTPSLVTTSDAGTGIGYTGLRIRGSDATRINVTINGIPLNDSESQGTFWVDIPDVASSTESVQVQRGVGTSTNGAGAFGGTVNLQTSSLDQKPFGEITTSFGSFKSQRYTFKAGTGLINNRWGFEGRVSKIKSDGYIQRASSDLGSYFLSGGYFGKNTVVKAVIFGGVEETYQSWYGVDAATMAADRTLNYAGAIYNDQWEVERYYDNQVDHYNQDHYQLHLAQSLGEYWTANAAFHFTYGRGYYEEYQQDQDFATYGLTAPEGVASTDLVTRKWLDNKFYGTTFSLNYNKEKMDLTIGGAYNEYANAKHFGEIIWAEYAVNAIPGQKYYSGESQKNDFNVYTKLNYQLLPSLNGFIDLQFRKVDYRTAGTDDDQFDYAVSDHFNFFNPKAGLTYSLSTTDALYISYAIANREPNRTDYLDSEIKPKHETLSNLEFGWRKASTKYKLELNYYLMNYKNQLVLTGQLNDVGSPIRANIGKSFRTGIEASGSVQVTKDLAWNANVTYSANRNIDYVWYDGDNQMMKKNTTIILSPSLIAASGLSYSPIKGLNATVMSKYVGKQFLDNTENDDLTLESYFINDLRLAYTLNELKTLDRLEFGVMINNIFDEMYASNGYAYDGTPYYYPQAGRNFMVMVSARF